MKFQYYRIQCMSLIPLYVPNETVAVISNYFRVNVACINYRSVEIHRTKFQPNIVCRENISGINVIKTDIFNPTFSKFGRESSWYIDIVMLHGNFGRQTREPSKNEHSKLKSR